MGKFKFTENVKNEICAKINVSEKAVDIIHKLYGDFSEKMKSQYLAHLIRTVEEKLREKPGYSNFIIQCKPFAFDNDKIKKYGSAQYFEEQQFYCIFYSPKLEEKLIRVIIAHELGHLILETYREQIGSGETTEPLSSVFGILAILEKNEFYSSEANHFLHENYQAIINDFSNISNSKTFGLN